MKNHVAKFSTSYKLALREHLKRRKYINLESALRLGNQALSVGLHSIDLAKLHEQTLVKELLPACPRENRGALIKQAGVFFVAAITPIEKIDSGSSPSAAPLKKFIEALSERTVELAASNLELKFEIAQRKSAEQALKKNERHYAQLLVESEALQERLRRLSRQILSAQEEERKKISRELHDVIAQTLSSINIRLANLKKDAARNMKGFGRSIAFTQRLVERSVNIVHQFARELRPAILDDLGLIPALHSYLKNFTKETGVQSPLVAADGVEEVDGARRTVLFRVAQEALTNVARHAQARTVQIIIEKLSQSIRMRIRDDGKSFRVEPESRDWGQKHLGLLGMRERLEMVGGKFDVVSSAGRGTTIVAQIPLVKTARGSK